MSRPSRSGRAGSAKSRARLVVVRSQPVTPVEHFAAAMAADLGLGDGSSDRRTRRQLLRLTQWATAEGMALDREVILDPDSVERFVATALSEERSRATYRAVLRRVGPLLTRQAPWEPRQETIARRPLALPYRAEEVLTLVNDAVNQPTRSRQRAAWALLVLGLGVGLDGRWATRVRASDVSRRGPAVAVDVGEPGARSVVALGAWEDELLALAATAGEEFLVGGRSTSSRRTGHLTERLIVPTGHPRLAPARLRSTWLLWHLEAGTRLPELCHAAGLQGIGMLSELLQYAEPLCEHLTAEMLREAML